MNTTFPAVSNPTKLQTTAGLSRCATAPHTKKCTGNKIAKYVRYVHKPANVKTTTGTTAHNIKIHRFRAPLKAITTNQMSAAINANRCNNNGQSPNVVVFVKCIALRDQICAWSNSASAAIPSTSSIRPPFMIASA